MPALRGHLTSQLQHLRRGDKVLISRKPTGTLVLDDLPPGRRLWMLATGTGLALFLSLIKEPEVYERFEEAVLVHGVRRIRDMAKRQMIEQDLPLPFPDVVQKGQKCTRQFKCEPHAFTFKYLFYLGFFWPCPTMAAFVIWNAAHARQYTRCPVLDRASAR